MPLPLRLLPPEGAPLVAELLVRSGLLREDGRADAVELLLRSGGREAEVADPRLTGLPPAGTPESHWVSRWTLRPREEEAVARASSSSPESTRQAPEAQEASEQQRSAEQQRDCGPAKQQQSPASGSGSSDNKRALLQKLRTRRTAAR